MVKFKKIISIALGLFILLGFLYFGIKQWTSINLPKLLNHNKSEYLISYEDFDISLWNSKMNLLKVTITPRNNLIKSSEKLGVYGNIDFIEINGFDLWSILFGAKIEANKLIISKPNITLFKNNKEAINDYENINSKVLKPFEKIILVSNLYIYNGCFKIINEAKNMITTSSELINFKLEGIVLNKETLAKKIPIEYKKYSLTCNNTFIKLNEFYTVNINKIAATENGLDIKKCKLTPLLSRKKFVRKIIKEKDLYTLFAEEISVNKMDWGFKKDTFYLKTNSILIHKLNANIYRGKMPADDLSKKKLYNKLLRELKADIKVDLLSINNSFLTYEEEKTFEKGPGKLYFKDFNLIAKNIESGNNKTKLPDVKISIQCNFMKKSPLEIEWSFNVLDKTDGFKIAGKLFNVESKELQDFTKPYLNIDLEGELQEVYFNFLGNNSNSKGDFSIKFEDLKLDIFHKKNQSRKNKFLSAVSNLFIKKSSKNKLITTKIDVVRIQEKSFYNLLWISLADGLKKTIL